MAFPENMDSAPKSKSAAHPSEPNRSARDIESEEDEMVHNDPAERAVSGRAMDGIAESGDRDPLIGHAVGDADEASRLRDVVDRESGEDPFP
jgi:hypothetical protein